MTLPPIFWTFARWFAIWLIAHLSPPPPKLTRILTRIHITHRRIRRPQLRRLLLQRLHHTNRPLRLVNLRLFRLILHSQPRAAHLPLVIIQDFLCKNLRRPFSAQAAFWDGHVTWPWRLLHVLDNSGESIWILLVWYGVLVIHLERGVHRHGLGVTAPTRFDTVASAILVDLVVAFCLLLTIWWRILGQDYQVR